MKKNLIAIAVGAALAMPGVALAEAKVYGRFIVGLDSQKDEIGLDFKNNGETSWKIRDENNGSRFGVKGKDDLGIAGLEGFYQMEWGVDPDGSETDIFSRRNIFVGIRGGFGAMKVGFYDTMVKEAGANVDIFNDTPGDITLLMVGETRDKNLLTYTTPKIADAIELSVAVQPGEGRVALDDLNEVEDGIADTVYASAKFETEMFQAMLVYAGNYNAAADLKLDKGTVGLDILRASTTFKLRDLELGALYQVADGIDQAGLIDADGDPATPAVPGPAANGGDKSDTSFLVSAAYTLSEFKLKGMYGMTSGDTNDKDRTELALGVDYKFNKSTYMSLYYITFEDEPASGPKLSTDTIGTSLVYSF